VREGFREVCYVLLGNDANVYGIRLGLRVDQQSRIQNTVGVESPFDGLQGLGE
jgi:hypothetical protein